MPFTIHLIVGLSTLTASSISAQKICEWEAYDGTDLSIPADNLEDYVDPEDDGNDCLLKCCDDPDCHAVYQSQTVEEGYHCKVFKELPSSFVSISTGKELPGELWTANHSGEKVPFCGRGNFFGESDSVVLVKRGLAPQGTDYCNAEIPTIELCMPTLCSPQKFPDHHRFSLFTQGERECNVSADCFNYTWAFGCDCAIVPVQGVACDALWKYADTCIGKPAELLPNSRLPFLACNMGKCAAYSCQYNEMSEMSVTRRNSFFPLTIWALLGLVAVFSFLMRIVRLRPLATKTEPLLKGWQ